MIADVIAWLPLPGGRPDAENAEGID